MSCINKENGFGGRRAESVRLVLDGRLHQISQASSESSNKTSASSFVSEKNLGEKGALLSRLACCFIIYNKCDSDKVCMKCNSKSRCFRLCYQALCRNKELLGNNSSRN